MFLKPTKTYNHKPKAQLYKRYTQELDTYGLPIQYQYVAVVIEGTYCGVYDLKNNLAKLSWSDGVDVIENGECLELNYVGQAFYNTWDNKFYQLKDYVFEEDTEDNYAEFNSNVRNLYGDLENSYKFAEKTQYDKYVHILDFDYIEENDTDISNTQITKGAKITIETKNIRWDIENLPIEKDDYLVIDNKVYQVGDISISKRFQPMLIKTYRTELMRVV